MPANASLPQRARRVLRSVRQALPSGVILGRSSSGEGPAEFIPLSEAVTTILDGLPNSVHGAVIFRGSTAWTALAPGTAKQSLQTQGSAANPVWADRDAADVTYDNTASGLTAAQVQAAIDELHTLLGGAISGLMVNGDTPGPVFLNNGDGEPVYVPVV